MVLLYQPILGTEPNHAEKDVLTFAQFLDLLKEEEDYFAGEQNNTKLMITRLRKIFYDQWGWDSKLISKAASIQGRYDVKLEFDHIYSDKRAIHINGKYQPLRRVFTYKSEDKVNPEKSGLPPYISSKSYQVLLPENIYCDISHVLAGLDAINNPQVVRPSESKFWRKILPECDSNVDIVTWMGELASVSANLLFLHLYDKHNYNEFAIQKIINTVASSSDLIADIDAYVISHYFETHLQNGMRVSEILNEYYNNSKYLATRFMIFAQKIGLKNWNGEHFENELIWLNYYKKQLKYNIAFQFYSLIKLDVENFFIILNIWANGYKDILLKEELLNSFLFSLKKCIKLGY